jgi:HAMP domain-containing protein
MRFRDYPTRRKFILIFSAVLLGQLLSFLPLLGLINQLTIGSYSVDVAGRNRTLSERIVSSTLLALSDDPTTSQVAKNTLKETLDLFAHSLMTLRRGGLPKETAYEVVLSRADDLLAAKLMEAERLLGEHRKLAEVIMAQPKYIVQRDPSLPEEVQGVQVLNPLVSEAQASLLAKFNEAKLRKQVFLIVDELVAQANQTRTRFYGYLVGLFLFNVLALVFIFRMFVRYVERPLVQIATVADRISAGALTGQIAYQASDEPGKIARSINQLVNNLKDAAGFINEISQGNFSATLETQVGQATDGDSLSAALLAMRDKLRALAEEERHRQWASEGLMKFASLLRSSTEVRELCLQVLAELLRYLGMEQGGLYLLNEQNPDEPFVELVACLAYERRKFVEQRLAVNEGLVGRAMYEQAPVYLTDLPPGYAQIASGLGHAPPRSLLIMPLNNGEKIIGALELATLAPAIAPHVADLVAKVAESAAVTISNVRSAEHTRLLLEKSQGLAEELRANEEEMRQNLEELQATQEEMRRQQQLRERGSG